MMIRSELDGRDLGDFLDDIGCLAMLARNLAFTVKQASNMGESVRSIGRNAKSREHGGNMLDLVDMIRPRTALARFFGQRENERPGIHDRTLVKLMNDLTNLAFKVMQVVLEFERKASSQIRHHFRIQWYI